MKNTNDPPPTDPAPVHPRWTAAGAPLDLDPAVAAVLAAKEIIDAEAARIAEPGEPT